MRIILCLFMCCALLFTCVARPASATSVAVVAGLAAIPTAVAVACAFQALGVMSASNSTDFTTTVDNCSNWLTENSSFVVNGVVSLLGLTNAGVTTSYLQKSFVQTVWEWLFSNNVVNDLANTFSYTLTESGQTYQSSVPFNIVWYKYNNQNVRLAYSQTPAYIYIKNPGGSSAGTISTQQQYQNTVCTSFSNTTVDYSFPYLGSFTSYQFTTASDCQYYVVSTLLPSMYAPAEDLVLGTIQSPFQEVGTEEETIQIEIAPIYIDWTKYGVPDPNDPGGDDPDNDGKFPMWLPTGIPSPGYDDSVITQNQQQAQSGVVSGDITFEPYEPDDPGSGGGGAGSGTDLSSVIQAIVNVPTAIVSGIGNFISDFFGFNGNYEDYTVQLRDFFPFCIPFDLYDFITVLSAEPEAPVFHWEIPVPQLGQTFELEVDLSAWDDIAVLFRNLELLAFIFGLAIMTREKFLRS